MATRKKKPQPRKPAARKKPTKRKPAPRKKKPAAQKKQAARPAPFDPDATQQLSTSEIIGDIEERQALDKLTD